jgi:hypothetical protein
MIDMHVMLCRNRVEDFATWKAVFDSHAEAHSDTGLRLMNLWRGLEEPNNIFFLFKITDIDKARAFIDQPEAAEAGRVSGVLDGEYHFLESVP